MAEYNIVRIEDENGVYISKYKNGTYKLRAYNSGKEFYLGTYKNEELANEAKLYFINECNYNIDKFKQSKYWLELKLNSDGKIHPENIDPSLKKKSGVKGISYDTRDKLWQVGIEVTKNGFNLDNTLKRVRKCFSSLENAINFKNYVIELIEKCDLENTEDSDEKYQKLIYIQNQSTKYAKELKANQAEKEARENNSISDSMTEEEFKEVQKWFKNKKGKKNLKKYNIGDSVKLSSGKEGVVVDFTDTHYIVKDTFGGLIKCKKD